MQTFAGPVDLLGMSTGGSIAQQIAAQHPDVVRRLVLVSTGCRLGPRPSRVQRQSRSARARRSDRARPVRCSRLIWRRAGRSAAGRCRGLVARPATAHDGWVGRHGDDDRGRGRLRPGSPTDDRCPDAAAGRRARPLLRPGHPCRDGSADPQLPDRDPSAPGTRLGALGSALASRRCSASSARPIGPTLIVQATAAC